MQIRPTGFRHACFLLILACTTCLSTRPALTDDKAPATTSSNKSKDAKLDAKAAAKAEKNRPPAVAIAPEREAAALQFARENHPELAALLDGLKKNAPREYQAALVDLDRTVERIAKTREKSADRYQVELAEWKITSRIRLLAARLSMSDDPTVAAELRAALRERLELRLTAQQAEHDRLQVRVKRLEQQIEEMSSQADAMIEKQFVDLKKTLPAARPSAKTKAKRPVPEAAGAKGEKK